MQSSMRTSRLSGPWKETVQDTERQIQGAGIAAALPLLEEAVENILPIGADAPIVIADYGLSEGRTHSLLSVLRFAPSGV